MTSFIDVLLERLLATSVQTALLAAVVWLLCRYVPRLSPATQCWLWWLVALQVLLGLCMDPVSLPLLPLSPATVPAVTLVTDWEPLTGGVATLPPRAGFSAPFWQMALFALWVSGLVVMGWSAARERRRTSRLLGNSVRCMDERVQRVVALASEARGLRRTPQLRMSRDIDSPMVIGHFRPLLLLPAQAPLSDGELEMAVSHELEHLRRADLWWGLIPVLARHCLFFHPLMHLAVREYSIAREAACDAAVFEAGDRSRQEYGQLLVRLGTGDAGAGLAAASPTFRALRRRLVLLQQGSFLPRAGSMAVLLLAIAGVMPLRLVAAVTPPAGVPTKAVPASIATVPVIQPAATERDVPAPAVQKPGVPKPAARKNTPAAPRPAAAVRVAAPSADGVAPPPATAPLPESKPAYVFKPDPNDYYPASSKAAGEEGIVRVRLCFDEKGKVLESTLAESSGFAGLDTAAVRYGKAVRFKAGVLDGSPQAGCVVMPVRFAVKDQQAAVNTGPPALAPLPDSKPGYIFKPDPDDYYPASSKAAGEEGVVRVRLCFDEKGRVLESTPAESSGFEKLDSAALRYGKAVRFKAGVLDGSPQAGCVVMPVRFAFKDQQAAVYTGERMTANFQDIPVRTLLQVISETSRRDILVDDSVSGSITIRVENMPWDQVLDIVLGAKGLEKRVEGYAIVIAAAGAMDARDQARARTQ